MSKKVCYLTYSFFFIGMFGLSSWKAIEEQLVFETNASIDVAFRLHSSGCVTREVLNLKSIGHRKNDHVAESQNRPASIVKGRGGMPVGRDLGVGDLPPPQEMAAALLDGVQRYLSPSFIDVNVTSNVTYGVNATILLLAQAGQAVPQPLQMDIYSPSGDLETNRPLVILMSTGLFLPPQVNGGCYGTRNDAYIVNLANRLAKLGYVVATIDYRLGWNAVATDGDERKHSWINALYRGVQDSRTAVRFMRRSVAESGNPFGIDPDKITLWGSGTGGFIAYASAALDQVSDTFASFSSMSGPMVVEAINGNLDGTTLGIVPPGYPGFPVGDTLCYPNHVGYSSNFNLAVNMGGAMPDLNWIDASDIPVISYHVPTDPVVPCGTAVMPVFYPSHLNPLTQVNGSCSVSPVVNSLGLNSCTRSEFLTDPLTLLARQRSGGVENLFLFPSDDPAISMPWAYAASMEPYEIGGSNCYSDAAAANLYLDTIEQYFTPRAFHHLNLCINVISGPLAFCPGVNNVPYSVSVQPGITQYQWSYTGSGVTIHQNGSSSMTLDFSSVATAGELQVITTNTCGMSNTTSIMVPLGSGQTCSFVNCLQTKIVVDDQTLIQAGMPQIFKVSECISSNATLLNTSTILFKAGISIDLDPDFNVPQGVVFMATIEDCPVMVVPH